MDELGQRMTAAEFSLWWDEYHRNPWGEQRDSLHAALIAQTVSNMAGKMLKEPAKISEFILSFEPEAKPDVEPDPSSFFARFLK